jgi:Na+/H+ antiporter NhaD/arsenite permease-like protein
MIGSRIGLSFNEFASHLTPAILVITAASLVAVLAVYRRKLIVREAVRHRILKTDPAAAITDHKNLRRGLGVFAFVLAGFFFGRSVDIEPGIVALAGGLLTALVCRSDIHKVIMKVEWTTLVFFIGLFMLVGAMQENGVFMWLGREIVILTKGDLLATTIVILWVSALASAVVDNIPLVMAMIPLIQSIEPVFAAQMGYAGNGAAVHAHITYPLFWALSLGACLGGNGTMIGASANVVISQIGRRNGYDMTFWRFTKLGFPVMILSIILSTLYLWLRYFVL